MGPPPTETLASTLSTAAASSLSSTSDDPQPNGVNVDGNPDVSNNGVSDSSLVRDDLAAAKLSSEAHGPQPSAVNVDGNGNADDDGNGNADASANGDSENSILGDDLESELLYAIGFSVAPPREGEQPSQLLAEVSVYTKFNGC